MHAMRADFYFDLSISLEDQVSIFNAIKKYESRARRRDPSMAPLYLEMLRNVREGSLAGAMQGIGTPIERIILDAIQTGNDKVLADGLRHLSGVVEETDAMLAAVRKAITYPLILVVLFSAMITAFSLFAVPVLEQLMTPDKWPVLGRGLYFVSTVIRKFGIFILLAAIGLVILFNWALPNWMSPMRRRLDRFLPFSMYRDYNGALLVVALASMMRANISVRAALERSIKFASPWTRWHLRQILRRLATVDSVAFGTAFQTGMLSTTIEDRIEDASERSNPVESFVKIGNSAIARTSKSMEKSAWRLNAILLALCGFALLFMMAGFFSTAFELQNGIKTQNTGRR
jgi:type II secretory pathway component PulF